MCHGVSCSGQRKARLTRSFRGARRPYTIGGAAASTRICALAVPKATFRLARDGNRDDRIPPNGETESCDGWDCGVSGGIGAKSGIQSKCIGEAFEGQGRNSRRGAFHAQIQRDLGVADVKRVGAHVQWRGHVKDDFAIDDAPR
jgi:hypothetical protein